MALWGKTDTLASAPKYLTATQKEDMVFVDLTEAGVASNRAKGLKTPGWNMYVEYGTGRKRVETLIPMKVSAANAGDAGVTGNTTVEDSIVADS